MRDLEAYTQAGRNDPLEPQQMRDHPYDFVSLPDRPAPGEAVGHDQYPDGRWSGHLRLVYRTETPLHVGSGFFESAEECGLRGRGPVRGIMRSASGPVLPGSSWKGAIRSRFEAITRSCLTLATTSARQKAAEVPDELYQGDQKQDFKITDPRIGKLKAPIVDSDQRLLEGLSPADALFGCMGYRGRVCPGEGHIVGGTATEPLFVAPLDSPRMHRLATPGRLRSARPNLWHLEEIEGRKFYYDGDVVSKRVLDGRSGTSRKVFEKIDSVTAGAEIRIEVRVRSVSQVELGALLVASGFGTDVGVVRFGGYKPVGLGKVKLIASEAELRRGGPLARRAGSIVDVTTAVRQARGQLIDLSALEELHRITTRRRPS